MPTPQRFGGGPDQERAQGEKRQHAEDAMGAAVAEVDHRDDRRNRQPIADDRERPGVTWVALVNETADGTPVEVVRPALEQWSLPAVRTALGEAAMKRRQD